MIQRSIGSITIDGEHLEWLQQHGGGDLGIGTLIQGILGNHIDRAIREERGEDADSAKLDIVLVDPDESVELRLAKEEMEMIRAASLLLDIPIEQVIENALRKPLEEMWRQEVARDDVLDSPPTTLPISDETPRRHGHYFRDVRHLDEIDVYRVLELFEVTDPCIQHAVKKLLVAGSRGSKEIDQDIAEAIASLERWQEMREEDFR